MRMQAEHHRIIVPVPIDQHQSGSMTQFDQPS